MDLKDIAKRVRKELKQGFPKCKFSVTIKRFSGGQEMTVALMRAPETPFANLNTTTDYIHKGAYAQLNKYQLVAPKEPWICNGYFLTEDAAKMLQRVVAIANRKNWNRSDSHYDYFNVNYYFSLEIGKWDRPFTIS